MQGSTPIFGPGPIMLGGVLVVSIVGFEVELRACAAREQLQGFSDAFFEAVKGWLGMSLDVVEEELGLSFADNLGDFQGGGAGTAASLVMTGHYMMAAMAAAIVLSTAAIWAAWAPADMIAMDMFTLDAKEAWDRTDAGKVLPAEADRQFGGHFDDTDVLVSVSERPLRKSDPVETRATWRHDIQYDARHDGDIFSRYVLRFRLTRLVVV